MGPNWGRQNSGGPMFVPILLSGTSIHVRSTCDKTRTRKAIGTLSLFIYPLKIRSTFHLFLSQLCRIWYLVIYIIRILSNPLHSLKHLYFFIFLSRAKSKLRSWHDQIKIYIYTANCWHNARYTNIYRRKWITVTMVILATVQLLTPLLAAGLNQVGSPRQQMTNNGCHRYVMDLTSVSSSFRILKGAHLHNYG